MAVADVGPIMSILDRVRAETDVDGDEVSPVPIELANGAMVATTTVDPSRVLKGIRMLIEAVTLVPVIAIGFAGEQVVTPVNVLAFIVTIRGVGGVDFPLAQLGTVSIP